MDYEARAAHGPEFADEAKAVGIDVGDVVARATVQGGRTALFYTDPKDSGADRPPVYLIELYRDDSEQLKPIGEPERLDDFWDGADEAIKSKLTQTLGPPPGDQPEGDA